jgi:hypothetical protein
MTKEDKRIIKEGYDEIESYFSHSSKIEVHI